MKTELILSTYNNPRSLQLCLDSVRQQKPGCDSICVADDGSGPDTAKVIDDFRTQNPNLNVRHIWHEDRGFEKGQILNKAILSSDAEYLVFIDGDVMIRSDFVSRHLELARQGWFSTGSLIRLDTQATASVTTKMVTDGTVFDRGWLRANRALGSPMVWLKSAPLPKGLLSLLEIISPVRRSLCGANASVFRSDLMRINGYDETIKYGGQDKELGERLKNAGLRGRHVRYTAVLVHLDHSRGYLDVEKRQRHKKMIHDVRGSERFWTDYGIQKQDR